MLIMSRPLRKSNDWRAVFKVRDLDDVVHVVAVKPTDRCDDDVVLTLQFEQVS